MPSCNLYFQDVISFGRFVTEGTLGTQSRHEIRGMGRTVSAVGRATFGPASGGKLTWANGMIKFFLPGSQIPPASGQALRHVTTVAYNNILVKRKMTRPEGASPVGEQIPSA
jgi:hypothetical protein